VIEKLGPASARPAKKAGGPITLCYYSRLFFDLQLEKPEIGLEISKIRVSEPGGAAAAGRDARLGGRAGSLRAAFSNL